MSIRAVAPDITDDPNGLNYSIGTPSTPQVPKPIPLAPTPTPTAPVSTQPVGVPNVPAPAPQTPVQTPTPDPLAFSPPPTDTPAPIPMAPNPALTVSDQPVQPPATPPSVPLVPTSAPASAPGNQTLSDGTVVGPDGYVIGGPAGNSTYYSAYDTTAQGKPGAPIVTDQSKAGQGAGVSEYGKVWVPGDQPPAGLSDTELQAWAHDNPSDYGYDPSVWAYLGNPSLGTGSITPTAPIVAPNQPGPTEYLQNGIYYDGNGLPIGSQGSGSTGQTTTVPSGTPSITPPVTPTPSAAPSTPSTPSTPATPSTPSAPSAPPPVTVPTAPPMPAIPTPLSVTPPSVGAGSGGTPGTDPNGLPIPTSSGGSSYSLTPTTSGNSLTNQTITPGAGVDRFKIAQDRYDAAVAASEPQYEADLRDANRYAAAGGAIGSGALNTSLGNIADQRQNTLATQRSGFLNDALTGSIQDAYQNIGIAQQQQGFQADQQKTAFSQQVQVQQLMDSEQGQQWAEQLQALGFNAQQIQQAFENAVQTQTLSDSENQQAFYQAYEQYVAGTSGNPVSYETWLAGQYAKQAA